jgi:hypothetical protein
MLYSWQPRRLERKSRTWGRILPSACCGNRTCSLNYPAPLHPLALLYLGDSYRSIAIETLMNNGTMEMKERTWDQRIQAEHSWDAPESYPTRWRDQQYWRHPIKFTLCQTIGTNAPPGNPSQIRQYDPCENNHPNKGRPHEADAYISIDQSTIHYWYSPLNDSIVLILLSIHTELRPPAWALRCSPFKCKTS